MCQTLIVNSLHDFCLWGAELPNSVMGDIEGGVVAYVSLLSVGGVRSGRLITPLARSARTTSTAPGSCLLALLLVFRYAVLKFWCADGLCSSLRRQFADGPRDRSLYLRHTTSFSVHAYPRIHSDHRPRQLVRSQLCR